MKKERNGLPVNAGEKIKKIQSILEEREREEFSRLKIIKKTK